jgi:hypothetical protein
MSHYYDTQEVLNALVKALDLGECLTEEEAILLIGKVFGPGVSIDPLGVLDIHGTSVDPLS